MEFSFRRPDAHLHREPAGGEDDDDDDDEPRDAALGSRRLGLLAVGAPRRGRAAAAQQPADHGAVEDADGDERYEERERKERSVEDARVTHVAVDDALVGARRPQLTVLLELEHLPTSPNDSPGFNVVIHYTSYLGRGHKCKNKR